MRTRSLAAVLAITATAATASPARAQPSPASPSATAQADADRLVAQAAAHFEAGRLAASLDAFRRAHALVRDPKLLFAMAKLEVELGDCASAIEHLRQFLALDPGPRATEAARKESAACGAESTSAPAAPSAPVAAPPDPSSPPEPLAAAPRREPAILHAAAPARSPWFRDTAGNVLVGAGGVSLLAGGAFWALSWHGANASASTEAENTRLADRASDFRLAAIISGGVGAALVVGGILRYATRDAGAPVDVAAAPHGDGWTITAVGRF
jgi:hypothetical protein